MKIADIDRARALAESLQAALKRDLGIEVQRAHCLDAIASACGTPRWDMLKAAMKGAALTIDPALGAARLAAAAVPVRDATAIIAGILPRPVNNADAADTRAMLRTTAARETRADVFASGAGALVASRALAWLIRRAIPHALKILDEVLSVNPAMTPAMEPWVRGVLANPADPRLPGVAAIALCGWAREEIADSRYKGGMHSSDVSVFAYMIERTMAAKDAHALCDAVAQIPRAVDEPVLQLVGGSLAAALAGIAASNPGPAKGSPLSVAPLPDEPAHEGTLMRNWGPRWRRLDAPDLRSLGEALNLPMLGRGWLRITGDGTDADLAALGIHVELGGEQGDVDDTVWIFGVGRHPEAVVPTGAIRFIRDIDEGHAFRTMLGELTDGSDRALSEAMGRVAASQFADDAQQLIDRDGPFSVNMVVISEHPSDAAEGRAVAATTFGSGVYGMVAHINGRLGEGTVTITGKDGSTHAPRDASATREVDDTVMEISNQLDPDAWGHVIVTRRNGRDPVVVNLPEPREPDGSATIEALRDAVCEALDEDADGDDARARIARLLSGLGGTLVAARRSPIGHTPDVDGLTINRQKEDEARLEALLRARDALVAQGPEHSLPSVRTGRSADAPVRPGSTPRSMLVHILIGHDGDEDAGMNAAHDIEDALGLRLARGPATPQDDRLQMMPTAPLNVQPRALATVFEETMRHHDLDFLEAMCMGQDGMVTVEIERGERARIGAFG